MKQKFQLSTIFIFSILFVFFTIIGTLSHEYGHVLVAKYYGHNTELHYGSMNHRSTLENQAAEIYVRNKTSILSKKPFPEKEVYYKLVKQVLKENLYVLIGGPFQTIFTGTIGFIFLLTRRKNIKHYGMKTLDWLNVFLSLFWLREVCNLTLSVLSALLHGKQNYFGGDEKNIASILHIYKGAIAIPLGILGLLISLFVIFRIIPIAKRLNFILGGLFGGVLGYILWLRILGPIVMP